MLLLALFYFILRICVNGQETATVKHEDFFLNQPVDGDLSMVDEYQRQVAQMPRQLIGLQRNEMISFGQSPSIFDLLPQQSPLGLPMPSLLNLPTPLQSYALFSENNNVRPYPGLAYYLGNYGIDKKERPSPHFEAKLKGYQQPSKNVQTLTAQTKNNQNTREFFTQAKFDTIALPSSSYQVNTPKHLKMEGTYGEPIKPIVSVGGNIVSLEKETMKIEPGLTKILIGKRPSSTGSLIDKQAALGRSDEKDPFGMTDEEYQEFLPTFAEPENDDPEEVLQSTTSLVHDEATTERYEKQDSNHSGGIKTVSTAEDEANDEADKQKYVDITEDDNLKPLVSNKFTKSHKALSAYTKPIATPTSTSYSTIMPRTTTAKVVKIAETTTMKPVSGSSFVSEITPTVAFRKMEMIHGSGLEKIEAPSDDVTIDLVVSTTDAAIEKRRRTTMKEIMTTAPLVVTTERIVQNPSKKAALTSTVCTTVSPKSTTKTETKTTESISSTTTTTETSTTTNPVTTVSTSTPPTSKQTKEIVNATKPVTSTYKSQKMERLSIWEILEGRTENNDDNERAASLTDDECHLKCIEIGKMTPSMKSFSRLKRVLFL
ncbi:unnamed protein product [Bursaphelenchus okinawaensis]|uniref:Uncharacterized protein n=1 Tax=Bursaphelenchus okinawaensis TaxID=465554 RepID=A0A811KKA1_9BILA|nr:unnamed protein product [Bursaphelenchus okinawaensis]CAG9105432.1 unnamed protein product [Bursaphelenchus okinawaensis]